MGYSLVRLAVWLLVLIPGLWAIQRSKSRHKSGLSCALFALSAFFVSFIMVTPFENRFITFSSPESAYHYTRTGTVKLVLEGSDTVMVIGDNDSDPNYDVFQRTDAGWTLSDRAPGEYHYDKSGISATLYRTRSDDLYAAVRAPHGTALKNTAGNTFYEYSQQDTSADPLFYTYLGPYYEGHCITVNGIPVSIP